MESNSSNILSDSVLILENVYISSWDRYRPCISRMESNSSNILSDSVLILENVYISSWDRYRPCISRMEINSSNISGLKCIPFSSTSDYRNAYFQLRKV